MSAFEAKFGKIVERFFEKHSEKIRLLGVVFSIGLLSHAVEAQKYDDKLPGNSTTKTEKTKNTKKTFTPQIRTNIETTKQANKHEMKNLEKGDLELFARALGETSAMHIDQVGNDIYIQPHPALMELFSRAGYTPETITTDDGKTISAIVLRNISKGVSDIQWVTNLGDAILEDNNLSQTEKDKAVAVLRLLWEYLYELHSPAGGKISLDDKYYDDGSVVPIGGRTASAGRMKSTILVQLRAGVTGGIQFGFITGSGDIQWQPTDVRWYDSGVEWNNLDAFLGLEYDAAYVAGVNNRINALEAARYQLGTTEALIRKYKSIVGALDALAKLKHLRQKSGDFEFDRVAKEFNIQWVTAFPGSQLSIAQCIANPEIPANQQYISKGIIILQKQIDDVHNHFMLNQRSKTEQNFENLKQQNKSVKKYKNRD